MGAWGGWGMLLAAGLVTPNGRVATITITGLRHTNVAVLRQELLLDEGDLFRPRLAEESLARLRALPFLTSVTLVAASREVGGALLWDLTVGAEDRGKVELLPFGRGAIGEITVGSEVGALNTAGWGDHASAEYSYNTFRQHYGVGRLSSLVLAGVPLRWSGEGGWGTEGSHADVRLGSPLRGAADEWGVETGLRWVRDVRRLFDTGLVTSDYTADQWTGRLVLGRGWYDGDASFRLETGVVRELSQFFAGAGGFAPGNRQRLLFFFQGATDNRVHLRERFIRFLGEDEEVAVGTFTTVAWQHASADLLSDSTFHTVSFSQEQSFRLSDGGYFFTAVRLQGRLEPSALTNMEARFEGRLLAQWIPGGALLARILLEGLLKNEDRAQLLVGSDSGLRGYPANQFSGDKRLLINIEQRLAVVSNDLVQGGVVAFSDWGNAWKEDELINPGKLNPSLGVGLRLAASRWLPFHVARVDVGYAVTQQQWAVSFGTGQYF